MLDQPVNIVNVYPTNQRKRQHSKSQSPSVTLKVDQSGDSCLPDNAKNILTDICIKMAQLRNTIVDIDNTKIPYISDNEWQALRAARNKDHADVITRDESRQTTDSVPRSDESIKNNNDCLNPCIVTQTRKGKPEYISLAWEKMSLQNGTNVSKPATPWTEESIGHNKLKDQLASKNVSRKEERDDGIETSQYQEKKRQVEEMSPSDNLTLSRGMTHAPPGMEKLLKGSWAQSNTDMFFNITDVNGLRLGDTSNNKPKDGSDSSDKENDLVENDLTESFLSTRSKTMPTLGRPRIAPHKVSSLNEGKRLTKAKEIVDRAIKYKKVFTIQGGYSTIRHSLRRRGWVEKFYKIPVPQKKPSVVKKQKNSDEDDNDFDDDVVDDDDDFDDDIDLVTQVANDKTDDQPKVPPWEEDDGIYGIMSRMVRNVTPSLFWVLKRDAIDYRYLTKDQMVNHYCKAGSFTTKVGLCINMKNVVWFDNCDHDAFFPRCYRLSHDEERDAFIEDYRLTACMNIIKVAVKQHGGRNYSGDEGKNKTQSCSNPNCSNTASRRSSRAEKCVCVSAADDITKDAKVPEVTAEVPNDEDWQPVITQLAALKRKNKQRYMIPVQVLETAIYQCEKFLASKDHEDIDVPREVGQLTDQQWDDLIKWYYQIVQEEGTFSPIPLNLAKQCESLTRRLASRCPQFEMDGIRNVWIVKPGAKSRGRGIMCYEKLEDMLKLVCTQVVKKDGKYVVQKYIERPLLIYNTKFDIRQWFLVTDWNPLTLWFYRDSYLRFCSQQFTLEDFDQSIHLSNNAVQKHYKNGPRSSRLPEENMWTHDEFKEYLASKKHPDVWDQKIYPQMKRAIICALLVTQDLVEYRKSSFELYGADFMLTEDFRPWLIEINSSPSMESSTSVTAKLCRAVLDDTIKVVVDRKFDRNCDIGRFELAYKQPLVTVPPYIGISLCVEGQAVKKPSWAVRPNRESEPVRSNEPCGNDTLFTPRTVTATKMTLNDRLLEQSQTSNPTTNSTGATVASINSSQIRKEMSRIPDIISIKDIASHSSRVAKETTAKVSTFRSQVEMEKIKANTKTLSASFNQNNEACGAVIDHKGNSSGDEAAKQAKKQAKIADSKKSESTKGIITDIVFTAPRIGDISSDVSIQTGSVTQPASLKQTTPGQAAANQRRFLSKSLSTNSSAPPVSGTERNSQNRSVLVSSVKPTDLQTYKPNSKGNTISMGSWNRACQWCGRGGNLHLDSADPNCRCQKDSVLVSMQLGQATSRAKDLIILNNHQVHVSKTWQPLNKKKKVKKTYNSTCTGSSCLMDGDNNIDYITCTPVLDEPQNSTQIRPTSALSTSLDHSNTNINRLKSRSHDRKSISAVSHAPDSLLNIQYQNQYQLNEQKDLTDLKIQNQSDNFNGNMKTLTSSHQYMHYSSKHIHSPLYNPHQQVNRGLLGSMFTTRVRNFLTKKENNNSVIKIWPSIAYIDSNRWQSPLSVIAQRHLRLNQHK